MSEQGFNKTYQDDRRKALKVLPDTDRVILIQHDQITRVVEPTSLRRLVRILRDHTGFQFKVRTERTAVDWPEREQRFDVIYQFISVRYNTRIRVKTMCDERITLPSRTGRYKFANQAEREVWDMFGIGFDGHPDLRRIRTDYGFEGYPRRKDFPLTGYTEVRYDEEAKRVVCEPLERSQAFRDYEFRSPQKQRPGSKRTKVN